ncbi:MAG: hypothetical protein IMZ71_03365 [Chloroflexi bacterium]|nr:hypothetical protein [Chloroflexota bacterium]
MTDQPKIGNCPIPGCGGKCRIEGANIVCTNSCCLAQYTIPVVALHLHNRLCRRLEAGKKLAEAVDFDLEHDDTERLGRVGLVIALVAYREAFE